MSVLQNVRWELFAQKLATGMTQVDAHEAAGYPRSTANASTLARRPAVRERVKEILEASRDKRVEPDLPTFHANNDGSLTASDIKITEEWLVRQLMLNVTNSQKDGKYKEANTAIDMLGNYFGGLFSGKTPTDKSKSTPGKGATTDSKPSLTDMMARMAEAMATKADDEGDD